MKTKTEMMMTSYAPYDNPYQGNDKRVLFVCSAGVLRSATAARLYAKRYNTRAAGSSPYALIPVSGDLLLWANEVVFVNKENYEDVAREYDMSEMTVRVLDIPDDHDHMHPNLIKAFEEQYEKVDE